MKQILWIPVFLILSGVSFGATPQQSTATFNVTVSSVFELSVDKGLIDFERMKPGETKQNMPAEGIIITSKTNGNKAWYLKVNNDTPFSNGPYSIPNSNFSWVGWTDGNGKWFGTGTNNMSITPTVIYASGLGEDNNLPNGTANHMRFNLKVPENQSPGTYTTTVKFTMTE